MRYMLLFCDQSSGGVDHVPADEREVYEALGRELADDGRWVTGAALASDVPGTRVQHVDGAVHLATGPFAEITDLLSGMFVADFDSHEDAIAFAARIPASRNGVVEVRQVGHVDDS